MNNGTSAVHCLLLALKYKYPSINKIYVPNNVFVSPWNCAIMEYDITKLEVTETDKNTFNMNVSEEYIKSLDVIDNYFNQFDYSKKNELIGETVLNLNINKNRSQLFMGSSSFSEDITLKKSDLYMR